MRLPALPARHRAPLLILCALALAYWSQVLFTGQVLLPGAFLRGFAPFGGDAQAPWSILQWDALGQYYPWRVFVAEKLRAGEIPLWNEFQFCGTPLLANGQSAVFYPLNFVFWILDPAYAFGVSALLHTLLAAFGTYFLTQQWKLSRAASLLSAIAFAFCGYLAAWVVLPTLANTAAWLPLLMWNAECGMRNAATMTGSAEPDAIRQSSCPFTFRTQNSAFRIPHSALLTCALLAGHPQIFLFLLLALALQTLFLPLPFVALSRLANASVFAGVLGAIQLLPMLELARLGHRATTGGPSAAGWDGIAARALHFGDVFSLFVPAWPMISFNENFGYAGVGVCLLAMIALTSWKRLKFPTNGGYELGALRQQHPPSTPPAGGETPPLNPLNSAPNLLNAQHHAAKSHGLPSCGRGWGRVISDARSLIGGISPTLIFSASLAALGLLYAFATPLPQLFYWNVPGLSQMGGVGRALVLWNLGAALLAGFGLDALRRKISSPVVPVIALFIVTAELFAAGFNSQPTAPREVIYPATKVTSFLKKNLAGGERVWFITPRGGWLPGELLAEAGRTHPPGILPPNGATIYGLRDINGYDSLAPNAYREWLAQLVDGSKLSPDFNGNMLLLNNLPTAALGAMNVRYVVALENSPRAETGENEVLRAEGCIVYENKIGTAQKVSGADFYPGWKDGKYQPETFRLGVFLSLCALGILTVQIVFGWKRESF